MVIDPLINYYLYQLWIFILIICRDIKKYDENIKEKRKDKSSHGEFLLKNEN